MTRKIFSLCAYISACVAIGAALMVAAASYIARDLPYYTRLAFAAYEQAGGLQILFDDIDWNVTAVASVRVHNLKISIPRNPVPLLTCRSLTVQVSFASLLKRRITVSKIILLRPEITLVKIDGGFQVPDFPVPISVSPGQTHFLDFTVELNKLIIENASVRVVDPAKNTALRVDCLSCFVLWDRKKGRYITSGTYTSFPPASLLFKGSFWFEGRQKSLKTLTGDISIDFTEIPVGPLFSLLRISPKISISGAASGKITLALSPGHALSITGTVSSQHLDIYLVSFGIPVSFGPFSSTVETSVDLRGQAESNMTIKLGVLPPISIIAALHRSNSNQGIDISLQVRPFRCSIADLKKQILTLLPNNMELQSYANRIMQGNLYVSSLQANVAVQDNGTLIGPVYSGSFSVENTSIMLHKTIPPFVVPSGKVQLSNTTFSGSFQASIFNSDSHAITIAINRDNSTTTVNIESSLPAHENTKLLGCLIPSGFKNIVSVSGGKATLTTQIVLNTRSHFSTLDMHGDLSDLAVHLPFFTKPRGMPARFSLSAAPPLRDKGTFPFYFSIDFDKASSISAFLVPDPSPFIFGSYRISWLNIAESFGSAFPAGLALLGFVNGSGFFVFPSHAHTRIPISGSISLDHLSLIHEYSGQQLIKANAYAHVSPERVSVLQSFVQIGVTKGTLSGCLSTIDPLSGLLRIHAHLFDIDDFLNTIGTIQSCISSSSLFPAKQLLKNPFLRTNLDMHFTVDHLNIMNWDFTDGVSHYTFRNGVMRWDNITVCGGGGTVNGFVEYNFSNPFIRSLTIAPSCSNVDFSWAVPGIRKKKTISGTLDLTGKFISRFSRTQDLGINMRGSFSATVKDGVIQKFNILSKILSLMNVIQLAQLKTPDIFEKGMPFDSMRGNFTLETGVIRTEDLVIRSPAMNLSAIGDIDLRTYTVDFILGVEVFSTISHVIGTIPFAGEMVTGKDKSLTIGYFHAKGPYDEASVIPMPVKSLSGPVLRVFKKLLGIPRELLLPIQDNSTAK